MACAGKGKFYKQERVKYIGKTGQKKIEQANIAIIGVGGLGCIVADTLTRMGVKSISIFDDDEIELSNIHRQILYTHEDIGKKKTTIARQRLKKINPKVQIKTYKKLTKKNLEKLDTVNIILECTDSLPTRHMIDEYAIKNKKKVIYAMAAGTKGYIYVYGGEKTDTPFHKIIPRSVKGQECDTIGILPTQLSIVTAIQINAAIKLILGKPLKKQLVHIDGWQETITKISI